METNKLPEDVKRKIEGEYLSYFAESVYQKIGAEFGYRLGLRSCEEGLKAKDEEIAKLNQRLENAWQKADNDFKDILIQFNKIDSLTSENERLRAYVQSLRVKLRYKPYPHSLPK